MDIAGGGLYAYGGVEADGQATGCLYGDGAKVSDNTLVG